MKRADRKLTREAAAADPRGALLAAENITELRKLDAAGQLRALRGQKVDRVFEFDREAIDVEKRQVWLSIASEEMYPRWWGNEILSIKPDAIRQDRLKSGAPLLLGHDTADQIGVVENYEITNGKKLRILARFGKSARAEEIFQDVRDGIRRNTSVGYVIHDLILEKQEENVATYRVTDWEPLEGSIVAVPADPTVGVGRAADPSSPVIINKESNMDAAEKARIEADTRAAVEAEYKAKAEAAAAAAANSPEAVLARERARVAEIQTAGVQYKDVALAAELIKDPNATVETFKARRLEKIDAAAGKPTRADPLPTHGTGVRHILHRGAPLRSFTQPLHFSDGTKMEPIECAYRSGQWLLATVGQNERAQRFCRENGIDVQHRVMTTDVSTAGGYLVPTELEQSVIDLRASYGLARRLARRRVMASDTKSIPKRTGGVTAYFVQEDNSGVTASDKSWGNVNLVSKTLAALSLISTSLEEDSIIDVVDDLAQEQAYAFALKEDQCWLIGDGTSTYGGMSGINTMMEATAYASRPDAATNHDTFAEYDNADLTATMGALADFPGMNPVWVCSKLFAEGVLNRLKAVAGGNNVQTLEGRPRYNYLGYDAYTSEVMPKVLTDLSDKVNALYGDFSMSSSFGDRRGIMIQVLRERYAEKLQVGILGTERFHIVNHDLGSTTEKGPVAALYGD